MSVFCLLCGHASRRERCQTETVSCGLWYVPDFRSRGVCVCVCSFGEGLAVWVLLSRVDRDRRGERIGLVLQNSYKSHNGHDNQRYGKNQARLLRCWDAPAAGD